MRNSDSPFDQAADDNERLLLIACAGVLAMALCLGGGTRQGLWSDAFVQLVCTPILAIFLLQIRRVKAGLHFFVVLLIVIAAVGLPVAHLIPLPPSIWTELPGREQIAAAFSQSGVPLPWLGISLSPEGTLRSALSLLPPITVFLSALLLGYRSRRMLSIGLVAFGFVSVLLGLAQLAQGDASALRFYTVTNTGDTVGFFANRNHFAALLYSVVPFVAVVALGLSADKRSAMLVGLALCLLVAASLLLGLGMARSRAGLALGILAGIGCLAIALRNSGAEGRARAGRWLAFAAFTGVVLILQFASARILQRLELDPVEDLRWELAQVSLEAADDFFPFGSGLGTLESIYQMYERPTQLSTTFVNHTHNDYIELFVEGGLGSVALLSAFFLWFLFSSVKVWRKRKGDAGDSNDRNLARASMVTATLLLIHSAFDYPLRTTALSTLFAFCCAMMIPPLATKTRSPRRGPVREHEYMRPLSESRSEIR